jgi:hypothetical protein
MAAALGEPRRHVKMHARLSDVIQAPSYVNGSVVSVHADERLAAAAHFVGQRPRLIAAAHHGKDSAAGIGFGPVGRLRSKTVEATLGLPTVQFLIFPGNTSNLVGKGDERQHGHREARNRATD